MNSLKTHIYLLGVAALGCLIVSGAFAAGSVAPANIHVLNSSPTSLTVEYIPVFNTPETLQVEGTEYVRFSMRDESHGAIIPPGIPEVVEKLLVVRLAGTDNNSVELVQAEYQDLPGALLAPAPRYRKGEMDGNPVYRIDPAAYRQNDFLPATVALLRGIGPTRGAVLGSLVLHPLQYNPAAGIVRKYTRIVCRVVFGPADPAQRTGGADEMVQGIAINDDQFTAGRSAHPVLRKSTLSNSVLAAGDWFRFSVSSDGMYKLTGAQLLAAGAPAATDPKTIKIYNNGGTDLPIEPGASTPGDLLPNPVSIFDGQNPGRLDAGDYLIFYGKAAHGWTYNPSVRKFSHYLNHFSDVNYYYLTYGGTNAQVMDSLPALSSAVPFRPATVLGKAFHEDEMVNILSSGTDWLGQSLGSGDNISYTTSLPGLDNSQWITYTMRLAGISLDQSSMTVAEHSTLLDTASFYRVDIGEYTRQISDQTFSVSRPPSFSGQQSQLTFQYFAYNTTAATGYIDWFEIFYRRLLTAQGDQFAFHTDDTTAVAEYGINGFSGGKISVYDVSRFDHVAFLSGVQNAGGRCTFQAQLTGGSVRELYVVGPSGYQTPGALSRVPNQNLHGDTTAAVNIIIYHPDFLAAAQRLKAHRVSEAGGAIRTSLVDVNQIYHEFGCGIASPEAIRNYLQYRYTNAAVLPKYVVLFGAGNFDYKGIISTTPNWIPAWETRESYDPIYSYATEDSFAIFSAGPRVNLGLGRLIVRSPSTADAVVNKIIEYETATSTDAWKTRISLVADDGLQGRINNVLQNDYFIHTDDAESVSQEVPDLFQKKKVYEYQYPTIVTAAGRRKPEVNQAIIDAINNGTLILNFNGHGNPHQWTHEAVFVNVTDFPRLHNKGKYFFLVAATCNYSNFDALNDPSGGELLTSMSDAGAIGVFSATRAVYQQENRDLNAALYQNLFTRDGAGRLIPKRIGDVLVATKIGHQEPNDQKYFLCGDPAMLIGFPKLTAAIDSVNHQPAGVTARFAALGAASINASVIDTLPGNNPFNGSTLVEVFDADKTILIADSTFKASGQDTIIRTDQFQVIGDLLFRGQSSVSAGKTVTNFIIPKDISYGGNTGRINLYMWNAVTDGAGFTTNVRIGGTDSSAVPDTKGPDIRLFLGSRTFHSGDIVSAGTILLADLSDEHGINTSAAGVGHRLEAWLDGASESIDLTNAYRSAIDDYHKGTIEYPLTGLAEGAHTLRLRAWDTYNNSSTAETKFDVVSGAGLQLSNVMNFPNPCSGPTIFTFQQNQSGVIDVQVKIYTVAGRLIQTLQPGTMSASGGLIRVPWDGRDHDGSFPANGVYLYKIIVKSANARFSAEAYGKLSVLR